MKSDFAIHTLSAEYVRRHLDDLIAVAADVPGEYWAAENFLAELPGKWRLSFGFWREDRLIGYAILSERGARRIHLHHFMVAKAHRNSGCGKAMLDETIARCRAADAAILSLKSPVENEGAIRFYVRHGFENIALEAGHAILEIVL